MKSYKKLKVFLICIMVCSILASLFLIKCCLDLADGPGKTLPISTEEQKETEELVQETQREPTTEVVQEPVTETTAAPEPLILKASVGAMGDLLMHKPIFDDVVYNAAVQQPDGTYDFASVFRYIAEYTGSLDYAVANLETTLCGEDNGYPYSGYPNFNCPDEIVDGVKEAGFDMLLTANNHSYDTGITGYKRTLDVVRGKGLDTLGTYTTPEETKWLIKDINGIKIGMLCYTWAFSVTEDGRPSLNGNSAISEAGLCNFFYPGDLGSFYEEVEGYLTQMKEAGAEASILFIHWGTEYVTSANETQKAMAQKLCDMGIDVIIGSHPHVIQPIELLESTADPEHKTICIYSTGNAVSNQRLGTISNIYTAHTEDGILFSVRFEKQDDNAVQLIDVNVIPTWVHRHDNDNGKTEYTILPLEGSRVDEWKEIYGLDDATFQKALESYDRTMEIVGDGLSSVKDYLSGSSASAA